MKKFLAAGLGLALLASPLVASAQDYRGGHDRYDSHRDYRRDDHRGWRGDHRRWDGGRHHYRARCFIRNEAYRGWHGRIHYRQVRVCR
jgi:hypothetical protein